MAERPIPVGNYELLEDFESPAATVRVLRMARTGQAVELHVHERSAQIYVALQGRVRIEIDGRVAEIEPFHAASVPAGAVHGAAPVGDGAILMNISVPPLGADDQVPVPRYEPTRDAG